MMLRRASLILILAATALAAAVPEHERLEQEIARVSAIAGGQVGVSAVHLESGRAIGFHAEQPFPMASTFKVPVAVVILQKVDAGDLRLDQMITLQPSDLHPGSGMLSELLNQPGLSLSVRNLMELMLLISDNSAADVMLRLAGGPVAVTGKMRAAGITGLRVDRPAVSLISDWVGAKLPPESDWTPDVFDRLYGAVPQAESNAAAERFNDDPRDTATPTAMTILLSRIWKRELLTPESTALLLNMMARCQTGKARLKGMLPDGTEVAHKTGTIGGTVDDAGIVTLPGGAGHVAITVFVKASNKPMAERERGIAEVARAVYDYFLFVPETVSAH